MLDEIRANEAVNISDDTMKKLRADFPSCFTNEGKFDWLKFKELLSDNIDITNEGYELNFLGKSYAKYLTSLDCDTLLVPDEEHNKQDINRNSQNVYITGDNFDSMKHLLNSYRGLIKCIYLDPPYNTGSDGFTYHDKFSFTVPTLMEKLNLGEKEAERVLDLTTRGSASHSAWCMFMLVNIKDSNIESNITELQKSVENAECSYLPAKDYLHIDIKMETGTGKTFVYTKTIFELHQRYGFNKFVIAVPSLPIKEGTKSFIEDSYVRKFFYDTCGYDCEIELCTVDAAKKQKKGKKYFPSVVRDYVTGSDKIKNKIYVLLVNMALLTGSEKTGTLTRSDYDSSVENFFNPLDAIGATRPIVIIDEPHKFSRDQKSYGVIENRLNPQCIIRYGATFPEISIGSGKNKIKKIDYCNLIYNLDAYASFEQGLIKGIAKEHFAPATKSEEKVKVLSIWFLQSHLFQSHLCVRL